MGRSGAGEARVPRRGTGGRELSGDLKAENTLSLNSLVSGTSVFTLLFANHRNLVLVGIVVHIVFTIVSNLVCLHLLDT